MARSHSTPDTNACNQFIPAGRQPPDPPQEVRPPDHGRDPGGLPEGPVRPRSRVRLGAQRPLLRDRPGGAWTTSSGDIIDAKRKEKGLPPVAATGKVGLDPLGTEGFDVRQPQHIALAGNLGLGIFAYDSPLGKAHSIDRHVVNLDDEARSPRSRREGKGRPPKTNAPAQMRGTKRTVRHPLAGAALVRVPGPAGGMPQGQVRQAGTATGTIVHCCTATCGRPPGRRSG